ncbi:hypothetical protein [Xanthocytophaga flava]|uniref:hypothetical protein n=1 Tax=Xanthocytophaga flava TaxID=3048013 RepID=UPI0028D17CA4|nr:hypothetical protein [Xanthocytophaga flavus]MDJ1471401.1 hypothetical protein [Xanthocytophaga flavus]
MNSYPSRRNFIKKGSIFLAGAAISGNIFSQKEKFHIPLQLYSVRDEMKKDALGTLKQLASVGYKEVEPAAYLEQSVYESRKIYGYSSKELRKILDGMGLTQPSSHVVFRLTDWQANKKDVSDEWKGVMEDANILGQNI